MSFTSFQHLSTCGTGSLLGGFVLRLLSDLLDLGGRLGCPEVQLRHRHNNVCDEVNHLEQRGEGEQDERGAGVLGEAGGDTGLGVQVTHAAVAEGAQGAQRAVHAQDEGEKADAANINVLIGM